MNDARARRSPRRFAATAPVVPLVGSLVLATLAGLLASCAPPPPAGLESLEQAARRGAEHRERRLAAFELKGILRVDGRATGRLPAVSLHARLATPDRLRLQCHWLLGLLADVSVRGDTLTAWMPGRRVGVRVPALSDTLGLTDPALFLGRALLAAWQAPHEAWQRAVTDSAGVALEWPEGSDAWTLRLDREGRPREVRVAREARSVTVRYGAWRGGGAGAWPSRVEFSDGAGWVQVRVELEDLRTTKHPKPAWYALALPDDARRLELDDVKRVLSSRSGGR
jgi:hypothetical protein